jgi:hypothetical protein
MQPTKFTSSELEDLVAQTVSWMQEQRERFLPSSHALNEDHNRNLCASGPPMGDSIKGCDREVSGRPRLTDQRA